LFIHEIGYLGWKNRYQQAAQRYGATSRFALSFSKKGLHSSGALGREGRKNDQKIRPSREEKETHLEKGFD